MALPPSLKALCIGEPSAPNTLELYLDYLCPFSAKQLKGVNSDLLPLILPSDSPFHNSVKIVIRPYPQPWHSSSTLLHESALAVANLAKLSKPELLVDPKTNAFWIYSLALMQDQEAYFDGPARTKNADQIRAELASKAIALLGEQPKNAREKISVVLPQGTPLGQAFKNLVRVEKEGNGGSSVVPELKYCVSREDRRKSIEMEWIDDDWE